MNAKTERPDLTEIDRETNGNDMVTLYALVDPEDGGTGRGQVPNSGGRKEGGIEPGVLRWPSRNTPVPASRSHLI